MIMNEMQLYLNDQIYIYFLKILALTGYASISLVLRKIRPSVLPSFCLPVRPHHNTSPQLIAGSTPNGFFWKFIDCSKL